MLRQLTLSHPVAVAVIAVTGYSMKEDRRRFREHGSPSVLAFKYLAKPVGVKVLFRTLREAFRAIVDDRGAEGRAPTLTRPSAPGRQRLPGRAVPR